MGRETRPVHTVWRVDRLIGAPAVALLGYLALAAALFGSAWRDPTHLAIGTGTDAIFSIWDLRWVPFAISHGLNPFFTNYLDYPSGANLMWSGLFPLPALLLAPVTAVFGGVVAYDLMSTLAIALSAWTAFWAIQRYVTAPTAAFLGGLVYGFSPALAGQALGHPQVAIACIPPLLLIVLDEVLIRQRWRPWIGGVALGILGVAQLLSGEELLAAEALVAIAAVTLLVATNRSAVAERVPYVLRSAAAAAGTFAVLAAFPLAVQFFGPQRVHGSLQPANVYVSDLLNFLVPTSMQQFSPPIARAVSNQFAGNIAEWGAFFGLPLMAVLVYAIVKCRDRPVMRLSAALLILLSFLSLGITLHIAGLATPLPVGLLLLSFPALRAVVPPRPMTYLFAGLWAALAIMPVLSNILPARLMLFAFLFAAILVAGLVDRLLHEADWRRRLASIGFVLLAVLSIWPRIPFPVAEMATPAYFTSGSARATVPGSIVLIAPYARAGSNQAMLWQADSDMAFKMPEGYALLPGPRGSPPDSALGSQMAVVELGGTPDLSEPSLARMRTDLRSWGVQAVAVGPMPQRDSMLVLFTSLLGRPPAERGGVAIWTLTVATAPSPERNKA